MKKFLIAFLRNTDGQDLIEYALLGATISAGIGVLVATINTSLTTKYTAIDTNLNAS
jgi:Flp pilus assembly pilin Flp